VVDDDGDDNEASNSNDNPDADSGRFSHSSLILNLPQLGVVVSRKRLYASYHRERSIKVTPEVLGVSFSEMYSAQPGCTADVYMVADEAVIALERECRMMRMDADQDMFAGSSNPELQSICTGDFTRLEGWKLKAIKTGRCERTAHGAMEWRVPVALAVISQNDGYWGEVQTAIAPAVLPRHVIFDMVRERLVTVMEEWIMQGYPHPDAEPLNALAEHFPIPQLVVRGPNRLPLVDQKKMIGNGMHVVAVGTWIMHQMSMLTFVEEPGFYSEDLLSSSVSATPACQQSVAALRF
jgi:hypothetical protein